MSKEKRLGRGLSALFESEIEEDQVQEKPLKGEMIENVSVDQLSPGQYQPRKRFDEESLQELADSIIEQGLMQPIIVRKSDDNFEIIAGERRWRAAKLAKLDTIPVIVRDINDRTASIIALIENMQRVDLSSIEEAEGIKKMIDEFGMTHEEASDAVGKSRPSWSPCRSSPCRAEAPSRRRRWRASRDRRRRFSRRARARPQRTARRARRSPP